MSFEEKYLININDTLYTVYITFEVKCAWKAKLLKKEYVYKPVEFQTTGGGEEAGKILKGRTQPLPACQSSFLHPEGGAFTAPARRSLPQPTAARHSMPRPAAASLNQQELHITVTPSTSNLQQHTGGEGNTSDAITHQHARQDAPLRTISLTRAPCISPLVTARAMEWCRCGNEDTKVN